MQADRASVAQELGGDPARAMAAPKHALQRKLLDGLRYLLKEELRLNQPEASDGWLTDDTLWLVSKTVSDKLRAHLLSQGVDGIPANNTAVFNVLQDHGMLQPTPEGKAIWKATVTSDAGWRHSFTFLRLAPALIWKADERPAPFAGNVTIESSEQTSGSDDHPVKILNAEGTPAAEDQPASLQSAQEGAIPPVVREHCLARSQNVSPDAVDELLAMFTESPLAEAQPSTNSKASEDDNETGIVMSMTEPPVEQPSVAVPESRPTDPSAPEHFIDWLKIGIHSRRLIINDAKALIHTVADTVYLVSPGVFQRYAQEHPQLVAKAKRDGLAEWRWVQKRFEKLQIHRKQDSGLNIWTCRVVGPRRTRNLHGYLLSDPKQLFDDMPFNNPYIALVDETATENNEARTLGDDQ